MGRKCGGGAGGAEQTGRSLSGDGVPDTVHVLCSHPPWPIVVITLLVAQTSYPIRNKITSNNFSESLIYTYLPTYTRLNVLLGLVPPVIITTLSLTIVRLAFASNIVGSDIETGDAMSAAADRPQQHAYL